MKGEELALSKISDSEFGQISELMSELRKIKRDDLFIPVARLQLLYLNGLIDQAVRENSTRVNEILVFARGVAYNIASFSWPGWGDTGPIAEEQQKLGRSAARVGLSYAKKAGDLTANIFWINGAHDLASNDFDSAISMFQEAKKLAADDFYRSMNDGWIALSVHLQGTTEESSLGLQESIEKIRSAGHEYSDFFADQLITAKDIFEASE